MSSVTSLQLVSEICPARHRPRFVWRLVLWTCGLTAGAILLFTELTTGIVVPTLVAMIGLLTLTTFGDHLIQKHRAAPTSFVRKNFTSFEFRSHKLRKSSRLNFDNFTREERMSWLKNEPNFTKRIVAPLDLTDPKHRRRVEI